MTRSERRAFKKPVEMEGVTYRVKECHRCSITYLTAEMLLTEKLAETFELLLTPSLSSLLEERATLTETSESEGS